MSDNKRVKYEDWMGGDDSHSDHDVHRDVFEKSEYEGKKGHLLL
jgi:hypothetical protein